MQPLRPIFLRITGKAGWFAVSSLIICSLSGLLLLIPYDRLSAWNSLFSMIVYSHWSTFIRNLHYWTAQFLVISLVVHIIDHLNRSGEKRISSRVTWLVLTLVLPVLLYEMISGFMLKGDAAGLQARRIVASILDSVPLIGGMLKDSLAGNEDNWQVVFAQHIGAGTIFLFVALLKHVKKIWPDKTTWATAILLAAFLGFLLRAPLGTEETTQLKGPWFFTGIQEMLHWISQPAWLAASVALILVIFYLLPAPDRLYRRIIKMSLATGGIVYLLLTLLVFFFRGENWEWQPIGTNQLWRLMPVFDPVQFSGNRNLGTLQSDARKESCLLCHRGMEGLSASHATISTGCASCHAGDPLSTDKTLAHKNMYRVPGNFSNVMQTCGTANCHREIASRLTNSLMATQSGIIGVDKFVFGETPSPDDTFRVSRLGHSAADTHLRNLCAGCHLGVEKPDYGTAAWLERGGGCNACHLRYDRPSRDALARLRTGQHDLGQEHHPAIDLQVRNESCKSCHSRSGRISLSFEGWNETSLESIPDGDTVHFQMLPDKRVVQFAGADIHHTQGISCIDCHGSLEVMGDGNRVAHKENAVRVQCTDCHTRQKPNLQTIGSIADRESRMIASLRNYHPDRKIVVTSDGKRPLLNMHAGNQDSLFLEDKLTGRNHYSKPPSPLCSQGSGHSRLGCGACHTAWVPQCLGCHNSYEPQSAGFDLLTGKPVKGTWIEYAGNSFAGAPVLGVREGKVPQVVTAMPGMILTTDLESFRAGAGKSFHRLYAPASGHTTTREARNCQSCHNDPLALGFGRGTLYYSVSGGVGEWIFRPRYSTNPADLLPEDAWTGFLQEPGLPCSTRKELRPFHVEEQKRILTAGSCLTCHDGKSVVMASALEDFNATIARRRPACVMPVWKR